MTLRIDGSTPAIAVQNSNTTTTVASASFTPPAGALLLVQWGWSTNGADPVPANPTITDSLGGHLTYTPLDVVNRNTSPFVEGQAAQWSATVATSAPMTITVTAGNISGDGGALLVTVLTDDKTPTIGVHGGLSSASAAAIAQSYTASKTGGWGFIATLDWSATGAQTAGTGTTLTGSNTADTTVEYGFLRRTSADDVGGVSNTINVTLPGTSGALNWVYAEVLPNATPAPQPRTPWRGHPSVLDLGRVVAYQAAANITTPATVPPPPFVASFIGRRRPPVIRQPRGQFWQVPPNQAGSTPCTPPVFGSIGTLHGASTSTPAFVVPSGVASGDIIVVAFFADVSTTTVTGFPAGFAHAQNSPRTVNAGGTNNHVLNVCWKRASAADTGTYTFTLSAAVFVYGNAVRYTGCQSAGNPWDSPTSAADGGSAITNTTPAVVASTAGGNRLWFFAGTNWNGDGGTWSAPASFNQRQGGVNTSDIEISDLVQVVQGSSGTVQASDTLAGQSGAWLGALIGTCPTSTVLPKVVSSRRPNGLARIARGKLWTVPYTVVVTPSTAVPTPSVVSSRRPNGLARIARGKFWQSPLPLAAPPVAAPYLRRKHGLARQPRGQFWQVPPTVVVVPPTAVPVPKVVASGRRVSLRTTRGRFWSAPPIAVASPTFVLSRRPAALARVARGRFFGLAPVAAPPIPARITGRIYRPVSRRGQFFVTPVSVRSVAVPPLAREQIRPLSTWRRGKFLFVPVPVIVATNTGPLVSKTTRLPIHWPGPTRRGKFWPSMASSQAAVPTTPLAPKTMRLPIHWPGPTRRGKFWPTMASSQAAVPVSTGPVRMIQPHQQTRILNRRGRITPVVGGQANWVAPLVAPSARLGARTTRPGTTPHGRTWITTTTPTGSIPRPPTTPTRAARPSVARRGRFFPCMPSSQAAPPPPKYVPRIMRAGTRSWYFARRGQWEFTRLTGARGFPAEFLSASSTPDMISAGSAAVLLQTTGTGSAEFIGNASEGATFVDGSSGTEMRTGP